MLLVNVLGINIFLACFIMYQLINSSGTLLNTLMTLTLFLSKLTGTSIGFTAMGFFTITKEVILAMVGLYLTYFFLLLQFRIT
ncbi:uncharacterized protein LOC126821336 [Patella vulgata]|uniref:uncharacterized protein LOC126821336 n=1 Tax=Patella vulgata TaxID=6465 RepID=UPI0021802EA2|nr:uncharacterized protein LOC126821336 [Patella vulgata]